MSKHPLSSISCPWVAQGNGAIHNRLSFTPSWSLFPPVPRAPPCVCMWRPALHSAYLHRDRLVLHGPLLETSFSSLEHFLPCCSDLGVCRTVSLTFSSLPSAVTQQFFFNLFSLRCTQHHSWLRSGSSGSFLEKLELAEIWNGSVMGFAHTGHSCSISATENLPCKPNADRKTLEISNIK